MNTTQIIAPAPLFKAGVGKCIIRLRECGDENVQRVTQAENKMAGLSPAIMLFKAL